MTYKINEVFYSLQGEGTRAGTPAVFVRFSACNLVCRRETHGFDCDTEFTSGRRLDLDELLRLVSAAGKTCRFVHLTGGEPTLQVDAPLIEALHAAGYQIGIETNGTNEVPEGCDWIVVSPKVAEHAIRQRVAHEVKYVRGHGQALPNTVVRAQHRLISPAFDGADIDPDALAWCVKLVRDNPEWRLSVQLHKLWGIR